MDMPDENNVDFTKIFYRFQTFLAHYKTLTGKSVTIDPNSIYISETGNPVTSTLQMAETINKQNKEIREVRSTIKRLEKKLDRTREQLELGETPWIEIRDIRDLLEELIPSATATTMPQPKPQPEPKQSKFYYAQKPKKPPFSTQPYYNQKKTPDNRCRRCRGTGHYAKECRAKPPSRPCPTCQGKHWMHDCPTRM